MKKFVKCRIIESDEPRPSCEPKPKPSHAARRIIDIYRTPKPQFGPLSSQLNTFL